MFDFLYFPWQKGVRNRKLCILIKPICLFYTLVWTDKLHVKLLCRTFVLVWTAFSADSLPTHKLPIHGVLLIRAGERYSSSNDCTNDVHQPRQTTWITHSLHKHCIVTYDCASRNVRCCKLTLLDCYVHCAGVGGLQQLLVWLGRLIEELDQ